VNLRSPLSVDLFCGGGGTSRGVEAATGSSPTYAVNHDEAAIAAHATNHPSTIHLQTSVWAVDPRTICGGRQPWLLTASPDCGHFSRAKGSAPRDSKIRDLAWVVRDWARDVRPRLIVVENVPEFTTWGPLDDDGKPIKVLAGETFAAWVRALRTLGYTVSWRVLCAADYGVPTSRRRLFVLASLGPHRWPEPTHGPGLLPYRTAAECIDWTIPVPSIFGRARPLAEATQRRIAEGLRRYVVEAAEPFVVPGSEGSTAMLVQTGYGERKGQTPRALDIQAPLGTVVAGGVKHALVTSAWVTKFYKTSIGSSLRDPLPTVTATGEHLGLVTAQLALPMARQPADGLYAWLIKYYGTAVGSDLRDPMHTITTVDRFGLATAKIGGEPRQLVDIGLRMLQPRELATASGFSGAYVLEGSKREQVARIGHAVPPPVVEALVRANADYQEVCDG
jgi:DNA (cytosine-5)-methyltransferase 1